MVLDIAPVEYRSNDGTSWELINGIIEACATLPLDEVASKKVSRRESAIFSVHSSANHNPYRRRRTGSSTLPEYPT